MPPAHGRGLGRPTVVNEDILRAARDRLQNPFTSVSSIAASRRELGISSPQAPPPERGWDDSAWIHRVDSLTVADHGL